ncbi:MAG: DUF4143 domain-containing protein [Acidobacteriota bacterium]
MYARMLSKPLAAGHSFFLFGPRGTGKTTWLKQRCGDAVFIDLLDADVYQSLLAHPGRLADFVPRNHRGWVVVDEVQRAPEILNEVHRMIEARGWRFVLTGSSARRLRRGGVNLLAGRAHTYRMFPLVAGELGDDFDLRKSLLYGHMPAIFSEPAPRDYLASYVKTYLREEVLQEGLTRNIASFVRFLETASFSQASTLNTAEIAREAGIDRRTVGYHFDLLEDLLLGFRVPVFTRRAKRRMAAHPKFYFFDVGVYRQLRPSGPLDTPEEIEGAALESLVMQELLAMNEYSASEYSISYWRTSTGAEVDIVAYGRRGLVAIEVKRGARLSRRDAAGLRLFKEDYPSARCYLFYGGSHREYWDEIEVWPVEDAIRSLGQILAPPSNPSH